MAHPVANGELPRWTQPHSAALSKPTVNNSLTNENSVLEGSGPDRRELTWYICGPTVYDAAHVGHARNYVTFDIIRRILEDYFGYNVFYVMNVTDVDDKIILKARQNYLIEEYRKTASDPEQVLKDIQDAYGTIIPKQESKVQELSDKIASLKSTGAAAAEADGPYVEKVGPGDCEEPRKGTSGGSLAKQLKELETAQDQERLKLSNQVKQQERVQAAAKSALYKGRDGAAELVTVGKDALAAALDAAKGKSVQDQSIFRKHAAKYEGEFFEDMKRLGWRKPAVVTRVTEYMEEIVRYVQQIVDQGLAYESNGSVYFDTAAFKAAGHRYGKLCPWAVGTTELAAESEANFTTSEKKGPNDFALWKTSKDGEPFWPSPWGAGRPGWHIECSAMASDLIGSSVDIHTGGFDLKFPHHENELAQAEAFFGHQQWVHYFLHSGHLHIEGLKMSKSLKNFVTIREALEPTDPERQPVSPRQLRLLFVLSSWDKPMNYGESALRDVLTKERELRNFFQNTHVALRECPPAEAAHQRWGEAETDLSNKIREAQVEVRERLEDNFDTPGAMRAIDKVVSAVNKYISRAPEERQHMRAFLLERAALFVKRILSVFGLMDGSDESAFDFSGEAAGSSTSRQKVLEPVLDAFAAFRDEVRATAKAAGSQALLEASDRVRDETMVDLGVRLEDRAGAPSVWKLEDPETLRKERDDKRKAEVAAAKQKLKNKRDNKEKDIKKWEKASVSPADLFKAGGDAKDQPKYSAFTEEGMPTHDAEGKELSKSAQKAVEKEFKRAKRAYEEYEKMGPGFLDDLRRELQDLDDQISQLSEDRSAYVSERQHKWLWRLTIGCTWRGHGQGGHG